MRVSHGGTSKSESVSALREAKAEGSLRRYEGVFLGSGDPLFADDVFCLDLGMSYALQLESLFKLSFEFFLCIVFQCFGGAGRFSC